MPTGTGTSTAPSKAAASGWRVTVTPSTTGPQARKAGSPTRSRGAAWRGSPGRRGSPPAAAAAGTPRCRTSPCNASPAETGRRCAAPAAACGRAGRTGRSGGWRRGTAGARGHGRQVQRRGHRPGALPHQRDARRVAAEGADVVVHPAQGGHLIEQAEVGRHAGGVGEEAEGAEPVVERDHHHVLRGRDAGAVVEVRTARVELLRGGAVHEASAVQVHQHRAGHVPLEVVRRRHRPPHVEPQARLAHGRADGGAVGLRAGVAERGSAQDAAPGSGRARGRKRWAPAVVAAYGMPR